MKSEVLKSGKEGSGGASKFKLNTSIQTTEDTENTELNHSVEAPA
jgi:hypothetical protein